MTARERFHETMHFGKPDRPFMMPQWVFRDTVKRWQAEGMPRDAHFNSFFGFDRYETLPISLGLVPGIEQETIEETEQYKIVADELGGRMRVWKDREIGMPQWITYPLRGRGQWEIFKERLDPAAPCRYPQYWDDAKRCWSGRDYPLGIHGGSYYGWIRNWMGMEHLAVMYYDDPELVREITNYIADFVIATIERAVDEVELDFAVLWEDMAMKTGSLISPSLVREFMLPCYQRVTAFLRARGIDVFLLDCDGNTDELIPLWLEGGVNGVYPIEVAADCDALKYRGQYGRELLMIGAIDKRALAADREAVREEVMSKVPRLVEAGGYGPMVDHAAPPDIPFENFMYYLELLRDIFDAPDWGPAALN